MSQALRKLAGSLSKSNCILIFINQPVSYTHLLYVAIFFGCTILFQSTAGKTETSYQAEKLNIGAKQRLLLPHEDLSCCLAIVPHKQRIDVYKRQTL